MRLNPANLSAESVGWDATRYADMLPKIPLKSGTKASDEKETSLRQRYPPLNKITASMPCIIVDMQGIILTWYLPGILTDVRQVSLFVLPDRSRKYDTSQNAMLAAREKLRPLLQEERGKTWRDDAKYFQTGEKSHGSVNLSPAWFAQGHDVSASAHEI
jgi:hypothetical protein